MLEFEEETLANHLAFKQAAVFLVNHQKKQTSGDFSHIQQHLEHMDQN